MSFVKSTASKPTTKLFEKNSTKTVVFEFENWPQTPMSELLDCDREKQFSNNWIDALIETVYKFDKKRKEVLAVIPNEKRKKRNSSTH